MNPKEYQRHSLKALEYWLDQLEIYRAKDGIDNSQAINLAWGKVKETYKERSSTHSQQRFDSGDIEFPHACIKMPTGGGKTFVASQSIPLIMRKLKGRQAGLVIWTAPRTAIIKQTVKALTNKNSLLHQNLLNLSGGKLKVFTAESNFTQSDVLSNLCIMVLSNQSMVVEGKEGRRVYRDSGKYLSFFPDQGNKANIEKMVEEHKGLEAENGRPLTSLINSIRLSKPVVIIDESHLGNTEKAIDTFSNLNPSLMLEISATPTSISNILYTATGTELLEEEMIKLPIEVHHDEVSGWEKTLESAKSKRSELEEISRKQEKNGGSYIRPIVLIRAEHTGKDTTAHNIHAYAVKDYLVKTLKVPEHHIAIQSSQDKELDGIDVLSEICEIRYIITKDALKEGWDCPFAYVLAILGNFKADTGVTQLMGRIMRQPYASRSSASELNKSYIFCKASNTNQAVGKIKKSLEGMGYHDEESMLIKNPIAPKLNLQKRRAAFVDCKIYFPRFRYIDGGKSTEFNYDKDLLPRVDWSKISYNNNYAMLTDSKAKKIVNEVGLGGEMSTYKESKIFIPKDEFDLVYLTDRLVDIVPNIFVASRIIYSALKHFVEKEKISFESVYAQRISLVEHIRKEIEVQIDKAARDIFEDLVKKKKLEVKFNKDEGWELPHENEYDSTLAYHEYQRSLFEKVDTNKDNNLEQQAIGDFDQADAVAWWYRSIARDKEHGYFIQGWKRDKVYPDFLLAIIDGDKQRYLIIETKGDLYSQTEDTDYKKNLMEFIENCVHSKSKDKNKTHFFRVIKQGDWKQNFNHLLEQESRSVH